MGVRGWTAAGLLALGCVGAAPAPSMAGFTVGRAEESLEARGGALASVTVRNLTRTADRSVVEFVTVTVPTAGRRVTIAPVLKSGASGALFREGPCAGGLVAVNGSFYIREGSVSRPLGLVRVAGETRSGSSTRKSGGFLLSDGKSPAVLGRSGKARAEAARYALESTPILIRAGKDDMRSDDGIRFDRVAVGTTRSGATIVAGAFGRAQNALTLAEFGRLTQAAATSSGDPVVDLLAMDGGPSAHIHLPKSGRLFGHKGAAYLPNVVCVSGSGR